MHPSDVANLFHCVIDRIREQEHTGLDERANKWLLDASGDLLRKLEQKLLEVRASQVVFQ